MEFYHSLLTQIAEEEEIDEPIIEFRAGSNPGDGFLGDHYCAKIKGTRTLNLFVKGNPSSIDEKLKRVMRKIYLNEISFYQIIYPSFLLFERGRVIENTFTAVPKCYKLVTDEDKETLVLEDITSLGFTRYPKRKTIDNRHMVLMMEQLARFHSVSFAIKYNDICLFEQLSQKICCVNIDEGKKDFQETVEYLTKDALSSLTAEDVDVYATFKKFSEDVIPFLESEAVLGEDLAVITHGDVYQNNVMFRYGDINDPSKPTDVSFFDWQLMRVSSPIIDVAYFFYTSCDPEQLADFEYYQLIYHRTLCKQLSKFNISSHVFPLERFKAQWDKLARYALALSFVINKILLSDPDDFDEEEDTSYGTKTMLETLSYKMKNENEYRKRNRRLIRHFVEHGFLDDIDK